MTTAADFTEAAEIAQANAWAIFDGATTLRATLDSWLSAVADEVARPDDVDARTVLNWIPIARSLSIPSIKADEDFAHANDVGLIVYRMCEAIRFAADDGRITSAEETALLTQYNSIWG